MRLNIYPKILTIVNQERRVLNKLGDIIISRKFRSEKLLSPVLLKPITINA